MIYICEYDKETDSRLLLEAAGCFFHNKEVMRIEEADQKGIRWQKLRERILAWLLLEYALEKESNLWITMEDSDLAVDDKTDFACSHQSFVDQLAVRRTEYGKPYSSRYPVCNFNISHCETACACILSHDPVGIDIEKKFPYKENLKRCICSEAEQNRIDCADLQEQLRFVWSMKEAYVKMDGRGLGYGVRNLDLSELLPIQDGECRRLQNVCYTVKAEASYTFAACMAVEENRDTQEAADLKVPVMIQEKELMKWYRAKRREEQENR